MYLRRNILILLALAAHGSVLALPPDEVGRIDAFLQNYYKNVLVYSQVTNAAGEVISCVEPTRQPAINAGAWNGRVESELSAEGAAAFPGRIVPARAATVCPAGALEMRLPTREQIVAAGGLRSFLSKSPSGGQKPPQDQESNAPGHYYATVARYITARAAQTTINMWQPLVSGSDFSLSQMWVTGGTGSGLQTVEAGVHVYPQHYGGDGNTRFFIYFTADNYATTGCYNLGCGFVQRSNALPIGGYVGTSVWGGSQQEGTIAWYRDAGNGNWYLFIRYPDTGTYAMSGYYPAALFGTGALQNLASELIFGGEVYTPQSQPTVIMGSMYGWNGKSFNPNFTAYQRDLQWQDSDGVLRDINVSSTGGATSGYSTSVPMPVGLNNDGCAYGQTTYRRGEVPGAGSWGYTIYFGGRGYQPPPAPGWIYCP